MRFLKGAASTAILAAGLIVVAVGAAEAQTPPRPYIAVSDFDEPYSALPPPPGPPPVARYVEPPIVEERYYEPALIAPTEVYRVLRDNGFTPLGIPRRRGPVYTITAINLANGDDGRLVIDGRTGRIIRFTPAYDFSDSMNQMPTSYESGRALPPMRADLSRAPRPPQASPRVASIAPNAPLPKTAPARIDRKPATPVQRSAATQPPAGETTGMARSRPARPAVVPAAPLAAKPSAAQPAEATPSGSEVQPTQDMPAVQGLE